MKQLFKKGNAYATLVVFTMVLAISIGFLTITYKQGKETAQSHGTLAKDTVDQVGGKAFKIVEIYFGDGTDNNNDRKVGYGYIKAKLGPNSKPIASRDVFISLDTQLVENQGYTYNSSINCSIFDASNSLSIYNESNQNFFGVNYLLGANEDNKITLSNIVLFCFKAPYEMDNDENVLLNLVISGGQQFSWESILPSNLESHREFIFPKRS